MIYLGTLGRMVGIKCPAQQSVEPEDRYSFETTLEGRRKAQRRSIGRRSWLLQLSDASTPADHGSLMQFIEGAWGSGPWVFVSADAPVTNLLSPAEASCVSAPPMTGISLGGPVDLGADGWAGSSIVASDPEVNMEIYTSLTSTPVVAGVPVTGSAWIQAGTVSPAYLRLYWHDPSGGTIMVSTSRPVLVSEGMVRVAVTDTPPSGATSVQAVALRAIRLAKPVVTWTGEMFDWAAGEGCNRAVVHAVSKSTVLAGRQRGRQYANLGFTVTEVG